MTRINLNYSSPVFFFVLLFSLCGWERDFIGPILGLAQEEFRNFGEITTRVSVVQRYEEISVAEDMIDNARNRHS